MIIKLLIKKEQKELLEYNSYRSFADRFYNIPHNFKKKKKKGMNITQMMNMIYLDIINYKSQNKTS